MTASTFPGSPTPQVLKPALIAGAACGFVAAVPFLNLLTCCCCAPAILCGLWAAFLLSREQGRVGGPFGVREGLLVGVLAGLFFGMTAGVVGGFFEVTIGRPAMRALLDWLRALPSIPQESRTLLDKALESAGRFSVARFVAGLFIKTFVYTVFATLGGLLGAALFRAKPAERTGPGPSEGEPGPFVGGGV